MTKVMYKDGVSNVFGLEKIEAIKKRGWSETPEAPKKVAKKASKKDVG